MLQSFVCCLGGSSPLFLPNGRAPVRNAITTMSLIDRCQTLSLPLIPVVILPSVNTRDLRSSGFQQPLGLYGNPIAFSALVQEISRTTQHEQSSPGYRIPSANPPYRYQRRIERKTPLEVQQVLFTPSSVKSVLSYTERILFPGTIQSFLACQACNRDVSYRDVQVGIFVMGMKNAYMHHNASNSLAIDLCFLTSGNITQPSQSCCAKCKKLLMTIIR